MRPTDNVPRHRMRKFIFLSYFLVLLCLLGCSAKVEPETREKSLSQGFALMDAKKYDEAIEYFSELAKKDPHYLVKLAWASAYAARAGIQADTIYGFVTAKNDSMSLQTRGLNFQRGTSEIIRNIGVYAAVWDKIPTLVFEKRNDLQSAVNILAGEPNRGARLYSATLRVVVLKSSIDEGSKNWRLSLNNTICVRDVKPFYDWSLHVLEDLCRVADDLEGAFPSQAENYQKLREQLQDIRHQAEGIPLPPEDQCF